MPRDHKGLRAVLNEITQSADRSPLFWWLVEHYDELATAASCRRLQRARLCTRFAEMGLTDAKGKPASVQTARVICHWVKQSVAKARPRVAAKAPPKPGAHLPRQGRYDPGNPRPPGSASRPWKLQNVPAKAEAGFIRRFAQNRTLARFAGHHSASARHSKGVWGGNCRWLALGVDAARGSSASELPDFVHFSA
jgi:hypothetical protein